MSTYEEVRDAMVDILTGREQVTQMPRHWVDLQNETALALDRRAGRSLPDQHGLSLVRLSADDAELVRDVFWDLFRQGFITLGLDDSNPQWPFFRLSHFGKTRLATGTSTYIAMVRLHAPALDPITQMYLEEAVSSFYAGCHLASAVMLGIAAEKMFTDLLDVGLANPSQAPRFQGTVRERHVLPKMARFLRELDQQKASTESNTGCRRRSSPPAAARSHRTHEEFTPYSAEEPPAPPQACNAGNNGALDGVGGSSRCPTKSSCSVWRTFFAR
jgi:hypothetical protein